MAKYSVTIRGHRTSYSLEEPFQEALEALARRSGKSVAALITEIDEGRDPEASLSSAIRLHVLAELTNARKTTS